jgi:prepilin-type N-terminal cleavage/methylation domain-containing protein
MKSKKSTSHGFTLLELMACVAVIGILAVIAVAGYRKYEIRTEMAEAKIALGVVYQTEKAHILNPNSGRSYSACVIPLGMDPKGWNRFITGFYPTVGYTSACTPNDGPFNVPSGAGACAVYGWRRAPSGWIATMECGSDFDTIRAACQTATPIQGAPSSGALYGQMIINSSMTNNTFTAISYGWVGDHVDSLWAINENKSIWEVGL